MSDDVLPLLIALSAFAGGWCFGRARELTYKRYILTLLGFLVRRATDYGPQLNALEQETVKVIADQTGISKP